jgi:hypothetical protein
MNCATCGHPRHKHDWYAGCESFLCCDRPKINTPGRRHTEHDGVNHRASHCPCEKFAKEVAE